MFEQLSALLDVSKWQGWVVIGAGLGSALVIFGLMFLLLRRKPVPKGYVKPPKKEDAARPDPFVHGGYGNKRETIRRRGNAIKVVLADITGKEELGIAWVLDRSLGGLCLHAEFPFDVGTLLSVRPLEAPVSTPWVQVEVKTCRTVEDRCELGCQFTRTPSYNVMMLFG